MAFRGFDVDRDRLVALPEALFTQVLPAIRNLAELKVTLHVLFRLSRRRGTPRCISLPELERDTVLLDGLRQQASPRPPEDLVREGLELAVARATLLELVVDAEAEQTCWYFAHTEANRRSLQSLANDGAPARALQMLVPVNARARVTRPTIYQLYEQNIGLLTPLIAEQLASAEESYPASWIEDAVREAVALNRRNWRYIQRILEKWAAEGKDAKDRQGDRGPFHSDKYRTGKYAYLARRRKLPDL